MPGTQRLRGAKVGCTWSGVTEREEGTLIIDVCTILKTNVSSIKTRTPASHQGIWYLLTPNSFPSSGRRPQAWSCPQRSWLWESSRMSHRIPSKSLLRPKALRERRAPARSKTRALPRSTSPLMRRHSSLCLRILRSPFPRARLFTCDTRLLVLVTQKFRHHTMLTERLCDLRGNGIPRYDRGTEANAS
jgi:hypothetical protein